MERIISIWKLHKLGMSKAKLAERFNLSRETVGIWINSIEEVGLSKFIKEYSVAKKVPRPARQVKTSTINLIKELRSKNRLINAKQIRELLTAKFDISISLSKVYEILEDEKL